MSIPVTGYRERCAPRSTFVELPRLRYHMREWGVPGSPLLVMLHGWMDVAASFQFLVDELRQDWHVVAPDWRGYGLTEWARQGCYWMPDYLADLDPLLDHFSAHEPVRIVGHSMGGNVATLYAGVRPERVRALVNLEGLGLAGDAPDKTPARLAQWLDEMRAPPLLQDYASLDEVAARLRKNNPRLSDERARYLAANWSRGGVKTGVTRFSAIQRTRSSIHTCTVPRKRSQSGARSARPCCGSWRANRVTRKKWTRRRNLAGASRAFRA